MAPDKFEKYVREKMRQREITPSEESWSKIAGQLPEEEKKRKKPVVWYSIAASFVGILIISLYFMQTTKTEVESPVQVVATEEKEDKINETEDPVMQAPETERIEMLAGSPDVQEDDIQEEPYRDPITISAPAAEELAAVESNTNIEQPIPVGELDQKEELIIEAKITEVVAEVRLLELNNEALTEAEVDSLLRKAQHELLKERIFMEDRSVDAMALLNEVEDELDRSFRDQIFDRLKAGFNKVRTAVADRNN